VATDETNSMKAIVINLRATGVIENTTTRPERQPEVIEFAAIGVDWDVTKISYGYQILIRPSRWRHTPERQPFSAHAETIRSLIEDGDIVVGHQLAAEMEMIDLEFSRLGRKIAWPRHKICIMEQSVQLAGRQLELRELHKQLIGRDYKNARHVMADIAATLRCLREMRRRDLV
jgi:hypothetical protein